MPGPPGGIRIEEWIERTAFEGWIAPELALLSAAVNRVIAMAALEPNSVDRVFLTGGTAFVPAVRRLFEARFGAARMCGGREFVSAAEGLALIGQERMCRQGRS